MSASGTVACGLSVSVFSQKSRFTFGGTYGFGRMCYVTFGLLSVSAESKTSVFDLYTELRNSTVDVIQRGELT